MRYNKYRSYGNYGYNANYNPDRPKGGSDEGYYRQWCSRCNAETEWDNDACLGDVCYRPSSSR
jgi:hypothetical protein